MAFDGFCLHFLIDELKEALLDTRIEKIHQPAKDEFLLILKGAGVRGGRLYLCTNASCARVCLTQREIANPKEPPGFCMLLRKKLRSARLTDIEQLGLDRIVSFAFEGRNEMGDLVKYRLIVEMMGRHSNLIFTDETGMIIDSSKHVDALMSAKRQILPHLTYELPPTVKKFNLALSDVSEVADKILACSDLAPEKAIQSTLEGIGASVAGEVAFFAKEGEGKLSRERLTFFLGYLKNLLIDGGAKSVVYQDSEGTPKDLSFLDFKQYGDLYTKKEYADFSSLLEDFYGEKSKSERLRQRAGDLLQWAHSSVGRLEKKILLQKEELLACKDRESYRMQGDLVSANLWRIQKGDRLLETENFYEDNAPCKIPLDVLLTPAQNAQAYYKKYKKAVNAEKILVEQIAKGEEELEYLFSVQESLLRAESEDELAEIRKELSDAGYLKRRSKGAKPVATKPHTFRLTEGFVVLVGRNNIQNDKLTLKIAAKDDLWFHTKNIPGAHTILLTEGRTPSEESVVEAAMLAAYFSKGKNSSGVPVDYCPVKEVKKPSGAKPGKVIYDRYRTLYVTPTEAFVQSLQTE